MLSRHFAALRSGGEKTNAARSCNRRASGGADPRLITPKPLRRNELETEPILTIRVALGNGLVVSAASLTAHHRSFESPQRVYAASERIFHLIAAFQNAELE
jgi:hypothetical protein